MHALASPNFSTTLSSTKLVLLFKPYTIHYRSSSNPFITEQAYKYPVPFLDCPWSYRGHGHDRIRQLHLVQPSRSAFNDSQTLPQLERPLCRPYPRHESFDPNSIPAHLPHPYNATTDMASLCRSCTFCVLGCLCFHLHLRSGQEGLATNDAWQMSEYEDVLGERHGCKYCA